MALVVLSLFPSDVDSLEHPRVVELRRMIEGECAAYDCRMTSFAVQNGVVFVGLTSDELAKAITEGISRASGRPAEIVDDYEEFSRRAKGLIEEKDPSQQ